MTESGVSDEQLEWMEKEWARKVTEAAGAEQGQMRLAFKRLVLEIEKHQPTGYTRTRESLGRIFQIINSGVVNKVYSCVDGENVNDEKVSLELSWMNTHRSINLFDDSDPNVIVRPFMTSIAFLKKIMPLPGRSSGFKMIEVGVELVNTLESLPISAK